MKWPILPHGDAKEESIFSIYFLNVLLFENYWGVHIDGIPLSSPKDLVSFIVNPPSQVLQQVQERGFILMATLVLGSLWRIRNEKLFQQKSPIVSDVKSSLVRRFREFKRVEKQSSHSLPPKPSLKWSKPTMRIIKISHDAIVSLHKAAPSIIARDQQASYKQVELEYSCFGEWSREKHPPLD